MTKKYIFPVVGAGHDREQPAGAAARGFQSTRSAQPSETQAFTV